MKNKSISGIFFFFTAITIILIFVLIFSDFFPNENKLFGHDYSILSYFLNYAIWIKQNGWFSLQWFSPSFCAGIPGFADPQNEFYSLQNVFLYYFGPVNGVFALSIFSLTVSLISSCLLLNKVCNVSLWTSLLGANLFVFNSFFISRLIVGHLTYLNYLFIPFVLYCIFGIKDLLISILLVALVVTYFIFSGSVFVVILSFAVCVFFAFYFNIDVRFSFKNSILRIASGFFLAVIFSSMKLIAAISYYSKFSKSFYPIPGINSLFNSFLYPLKLLIFVPPDFALKDEWSNIIWSIQRHELEYQMGIIPFFILALAGVCFFYRYSNKKKLDIEFKFNLKSSAIWSIIAILILLIIPVILNYHNDILYPFFKKIPIVNQLSAPTRWYAIYIPIIIFVAIDISRILPRLFHNSKVQIILISIVCINFYLSDRGHYQNEKYKANIILSAFADLDNFAKNHSITNILIPGFYKERKDLTALSLLFPNEPFIYKYTSTICYAPIFGYRLEILPKMKVKTGSVFLEENGFLNINDPRCYLFPQENNCKAGDRFKLTELDIVKNFVNYKEIPFKMSIMQMIANIISPASIVLGLMILLGRICYKKAIKKFQSK
ncbi:MAG: hypothetical protein HQK49_19535 [Oligoflexia bacterium]|nr:hypothetical protein [Oligoflexia bacterium]